MMDKNILFDINEMGIVGSYLQDIDVRCRISKYNVNFALICKGGRKNAG